MDFPKFYPQGLEHDVSMSVGEIDTETKYQNVKFADQAGDHTLDIHSVVDPTRKLQDTNDTNLEHFFRRPIKIFETEWGTAATLFNTFNPWSLYFENLRVINRITNYKLLRCKLKVKIVINGNSFHYGRAYAAYQPLHNFDDMTQNRFGLFADNVNLTQLPKIFLDPTLSQGGEMTLPFFWYANYLDICNQDWREMGTIILRSLTTLKHANGATDQVTISAFAWAEDVELSVLTSVEPGALAPQGNELDDVQGRISGPATTVAKAARALASVPSIAPFAMATAMAADATAGVAKVFGYSRPNVNPSSGYFANRPLGALALTNMVDQSIKLSVDNKQELTIDPRVVGLDDTDQMTIKSIASRESFLTQFTWSVGTAPETLIWNARVDPCQFNILNDNVVEYHFPACAMAALPFKYWTGTMKFRFQIVASAFHRGRLKIVYDPDYLKSNEYNTNYTNVIDMAETRDFTIEIGNGQNYTLLDHHRPGFDSVTQMFSTTTYASKEEGNGVVGVYVVNELSVPNSAVNNDIVINVFVSMGEDFEVFVPDDYFSNFTAGLEPQTNAFAALKPQGEEFPDALKTSEPSSPFQKDTTQLGTGIQDTTLVNKVYTGEAIVSFRQMLKRYDFFRTSPTLFSGPGIVRYSQAMYPFWPGYVESAVDLTSTGVPYNYCASTLWHWISQCYAGVRGGMRYKLLAARVPRTDQLASLKMEVERVSGQVPYFQQTLPLADPTSVSDANHASLQEKDALRGINGLNIAPLLFNTANEFEVPFYFQGRFYPHRQLDWTSGVQATGGFRSQMSGTLDDGARADIYFSTAEDFSLHFWVCPPPLLFNTNLPAPSV